MHRAGWVGILITGGAIVFIVAPMVIIVVMSFTPYPYLKLPDTHLSLRWYLSLGKNSHFIAAFYKSLYLATATVSLTMVVGTAAAYALDRFELPFTRILNAFFLSPLMVPAVIMGIALLQFLSRLRVAGSFTGLLIGHVIITSPYVIRIVLAGLKGVGPSLERAAMNLGAPRLRAFLEVTLPLSSHAILGAAVFAFLVSFDNLTVSLFLAGPTYTTLPIQIFSYVSDQNDPLIAAVSTVLIFFSVALIFVVERSVGLRRLFAGASTG